MSTILHTIVTKLKGDVRHLCSPDLLWSILAGTGVVELLFVKFHSLVMVLNSLLASVLQKSAIIISYENESSPLSSIAFLLGSELLLSISKITHQKCLDIDMHF